MLRPRIIPSLLVKNGALVKTVRYEAAKYIGDPLNAVRIFNEKMVDELIVLDIDATVERRPPYYALIEKLAAECRMPVCYGGGITDVEQVERIIALGVEKVAIGSAALSVTRLIDDAARRVGSQSIVAILDVREHGAPGGYRHFTEKGTKPTDMGPQEFARRMEAEGAGEILVNAIDRDGLMRGYDFTLVDQVRSATALPLTVVGGAGSLSDIAALIARFGVIGAAAGSLFVFKGPYRAVLINYPNPREKEALLCHTAVTTQSAL